MLFCLKMLLWPRGCHNPAMQTIEKSNTTTRKDAMWFLSTFKVIILLLFKYVLWVAFTSLPVSRWNAATQSWWYVHTAHVGACTCSDTHPAVPTQPWLQPLWVNESIRNNQICTPWRSCLVRGKGDTVRPDVLSLLSWVCPPWALMQNWQTSHATQMLPPGLSHAQHSEEAALTFHSN